MIKNKSDLKVMTIVGTRPELIRLSRVIAMLNSNLNHILVHTGQNYDYELNKIFFDSMHIRKPDFFLNSSKKNAVDTIAETIKKLPDSIKGKFINKIYLSTSMGPSMRIENIK